MKTYSEEELLSIWEQIGDKNTWIRNAIDPPFSKAMLKRCKDIEEMRDYMNGIGWVLGQGFYYKNLCFINQREGGDEWLAIKNDQVFDSISFWETIREERFYEQMERYLTTTVTHQLNRL